MPTVRELLQRKQKRFWTIAPDASVFEAIELMSEHNVGALVVVQDRLALGIITERDFLQKVYAKRISPDDVRIGDVMTEKMIAIHPEQTVDACMALMTDHQVRHLPVIEAGYPIGIVSIRDVVRQIVSDQESMIMHLEDYIMACPPHLKPVLP